MIYKRIFLLLLCLVIMVSFTVPAFAVDTTAIAGTVFDYFLSHEIEAVKSRQADFWVNNGTTCSGCSSADGYHNWHSHYGQALVDILTTYDPEKVNGIYYKSVICDDCGITAYDYITSAYQSAVADVPISVNSSYTISNISSLSDIWLYRSNSQDCKKARCYYTDRLFLDLYDLSDTIYYTRSCLNVVAPLIVSVDSSGYAKIEYDGGSLAFSLTGVTSIVVNLKPDLSIIPSVGSITGDIYTTNEDGTTTVYKDCQFVDETNNKYFNPTTNNWTTYNSYTYDYSTMTYNFVTDAGTTTINFGDTNITYTIVEGSTTTTNNYYYYIDNSGTGGSTEDTTTIIGWLEKIYNKLVDLFNKDTTIDVGGTTVDVDITTKNPDTGESKFDTFVHKFDWLKSMKQIGDSFLSDVQADASGDLSSTGSGLSGGGSGTAPSIVMKLGAAESPYGYVYGGDVQVLDLSWYAKYKPSVDLILSGFLWLLFLWGVMKQAPNIVSGSGMVSNRLDDLDIGYRGRKK